MTPTEILTLAPLAAMVVVFGLFPGILLDLIGAPTEVALASADHGVAITIDPVLVILGLGIVVAIVAARFLAVMRGPGDEEPSSALTPESARG